MKIICYVATTFKVSPLGFGCPALVTITDYESAAVTAQHFIWDMLLVKNSVMPQPKCGKHGSGFVRELRSCSHREPVLFCWPRKDDRKQIKMMNILNLVSFSLAPCKHFSGALTHCSGKNEPRSRLHIVEHPHLSQQCCNCRATHISSCRGTGSGCKYKTLVSLIRKF